MDQRYFNGIGNYLRAEILGRLSNVNPFDSAIKVIRKCPQILELCKDVPEEAYALGGGELKDWVNPNNVIPEEKFRDWLQYYGKKESVIDSAKRRFWLDKKWLNETKI
jgi:endonuclease VIII-like 1